MKVSAKGYLKRVALLVIGLLICSYGVSMTVVANLGVSPWDVFAQGVALQLSKITGTEILMGTTTRWIGWIVLILDVVFREKIGFGTIYNISVVGTCINFFTVNNLVPSPESFAARLFMLVFGFVIWTFGVYLYLSAELGSGPRDGLMAALSKRGFNVAIAKNSIEAVVFVAGWIMGGTVGIGSVIAVFLVGYLLKFWFALFNFNLNGLKHESVLDTIKNLRKLSVKQ